LPLVEQFIISPSSGIPIYKQLYSQIERMVLNGYFVVGDSLPSVRQVATNLEVNPMTVSKAYGLLEERGFLTRLRGKGMVVAQRDEAVSHQEKIEMLNKMITELLTQAKQVGVNNQEVIALVTACVAENATSSEDNKE